MLMSYEIAGNELLAAAIGWYSSNGALQLPAKGRMPNSRMMGQMFYDDAEYDLKPGPESESNDGINIIKGRLFPALAAISLGFDSSSLAKIISDHKINLDDLFDLYFSSESSTPVMLSTQNEFASPAYLFIEVIKAFASDFRLRQDLRRSVSERPSSREALALMHTNESTLWPSTRIEAHAEAVMHPKKNLDHGEFVPFEFIASRPEKRGELPNGSAIDLIRRSGMLTEPLLRKQTGLFFSWEDLLFAATKDQPVQIEMLKSLVNVTDKQTVDLIVRGLLSASADSFEDGLEGEKVYSLLQSVLEGHAAFAPVLQSLAFKFNLIPLYMFPNELEILDENPEIFSDLINDQETLLSRVANELLARPAEHLGYGDYNVFRKLDLMNLPAQVINFDPEQLVGHILDSMNSYRTIETTCPTKLELDQWTLGSLEAMAKYLLRHHTFDACKFNGRDDASKVALIKAGFDINLKNISRKARGHLLEDQIGL
jgi:hypothetical protein